MTNVIGLLLNEALTISQVKANRNIQDNNILQICFSDPRSQ